MRTPSVQLERQPELLRLQCYMIAYLTHDNPPAEAVFQIDRATVPMLFGDGVCDACQ